MNDLPIPPLFPELTWRAANPADAAAMNRLLLDIEAVDQVGNIDTIDDRERKFKDPDTNIETDTNLAFDKNGKMVAMSWLFTPPLAETKCEVFAWGDVHPDYRGQGLEDFVMDWMEARGRQILAEKPADRLHEIRVFSLDTLKDKVTLYEAHGYQPDRAFYRMLCKFTEALPAISLPEGITLESWKPELDDQVQQAFNASFRDHWGFIPTSQENWQLNIIGNIEFRPELSFVALAAGPASQPVVVGFSINQVKQLNLDNPIKTGWINELGVVKEWRKRGIATALLLTSMRAFREAGYESAGLGVDTENLTGALRIYERLGFEPVQRHLTFSKRI